MSFPSPHSQTGRALRRRILAAATCAVATIVGSAHADQGLRPPFAAVARTAEADSLDFGIYELAGYDSNLFRLSDGVDPGADGPRSSATSTLGAGLHVDKRYGLQRIVVDATVTHDHYSSYGNLDFTGQQVNATLFWSITPWITGDVIIQHSRYANEYEYVGFRTTPDPRKVELDRLDVDWRAGAALHPRFSIYNSEGTSKSNTFQLENSRSLSTEAALLYTFRSTNTASAYARHATGNSTDNPSTTPFLDRQFSEREYGVRANWTTIGLVQAQAQVGYRKRDYDTFAQRDFQGWVSQVDVVYLLSGKTVFLLDASRNLSSAQTNDSSFYVTDYGSASLAYQLTGKITLKPTYAVKRLTFDGAPILSTFALKEVTRYAYLESDWTVSRALDLNLIVGHSVRNSNLSVLNYSDRNVSVLARIKF